MRKTYRHQYSRCWIDSEHRLLCFATEAEKELEAFEKGDVAPEVTVRAVNEKSMSAKDRIKLVRERTWKERARGAFNARSIWKKARTWSREGAFKEEMAAKIEQIAKERIRKTSKDLRKSSRKAEKKLDDLAENSKPSILLLRTQRDICDEITKDLQAEIEEKSALRDVYDKIDEILGENEGVRTSDLKATKIPTTETLQKKMDMVSTIKEELEGKLEASPEGKLTEQIAQLDGELRKLLALAGVDIDLDQKLYQCLTSRDRKKAVEKFVKTIEGCILDPHVLAACRTIVKRITGVDPGIGRLHGWHRPFTSREKQGAATAANFYRQKEMAKETLNTGNLKERMQQLLSAAGLQKVVVRIASAKMTMRKVTTNGQFVRLRAGNALAVIDTKNNSLVVKYPGSASVVTHSVKEGTPADDAEKKSAICLEKA